MIFSDQAMRFSINKGRAQKLEPLITQNTVNSQVSRNKSSKIDIEREGNIQRLISKFIPATSNDLKFNLAHVIHSLQKDAASVKSEWINDNEVVGVNRKIPDNHLITRLRIATNASNHDEFVGDFLKSTDKGFFPLTIYKRVVYKDPYDVEKQDIEISEEREDYYSSLRHRKSDSSVSFNLNCNWVFDRFARKFENMSDPNDPNELADVLSNVIHQANLSPKALKAVVGHDINYLNFSVRPSIDFEQIKDPCLSLYLRRTDEDPNIIDATLILPNNNKWNFVFQET